MTLFEIDKAIAEFEFDIDEETGEILNYDVLDQLQLDRQQKIENVGCLIKNLEVDSEALKAESKNMAARAKVIDNRISSLKGYLQHALQGEKFSTTNVAITWRRSESVDILSEDLIPDEYCSIEQVTLRKPDKKAIKAAIKAGQEVQGALLNEKQNVQIA